MSFNEKLQKLRKENKYSQEELADKLDVTRQSVSKWESGQTYPEMDKLLALCKIFNCSLDELTNDEVKEITPDKKNNLNTLVDSSLDFVNKTYKMLSNMAFKDLLKCILTMLLLAIVLAFLFIPFSILQSAFHSLFFSAGSNAFAEFLYALVNIIIGSIFVALYILIFVYIFKIGFLDKYEFVNNKEEHSKKVLKEEKTEIKEEIRVIQERRDRDYPIFKALGVIIMFFVKCFLVLFSFPFLALLVVLFAAFVINIYLMTQGVFFFSILLFIIFGVLGTILVLEFVANILFNRTHSYKRMLITLLVGVAGLGVSTGVMFLELSSFKYHDEVPSGAKITTKKQEIPFNEHMIIHFNHHFHKFEVDETLVDTIIIEIEYFERFNRVEIVNFGNHHHIWNRHSDFNYLRTMLDLIIESLKTREFYNFNLLYNANIIIRTSSANIEQLNANIEHHRYQVWEENRDHYQMIIDDLQNEIWDLRDQLHQSEDRREELSFKIENLQNELREQRERLQSILD